MIPLFICAYVHETTRMHVTPSGVKVSPGRSSQVVADIQPVGTYSIRSDQWACLHILPANPTEHHDIIVSMYKRPVGSRLVVGIAEWQEARCFLEMSVHVLSAFDTK